MGMDFQPPYPVQFQGSGLARALMRALGWRVDFAGLPALQGAMVVYLDDCRKCLVGRDFVRLTGDEDRDLERMAGALQGFHGFRADAAAPVRLINSGPHQADTIVK